jgi:hypothetical protein
MNETGVNRNRNHVDKNEGSKERTWEQVLERSFNREKVGSEKQSR